MTSTAAADRAAVLREAIFVRGLFMHRYAGVEHAVTELLVRAAGVAEYAHLGKLPFAWPKRLLLLGRVLNADGPIGKYATDVRKCLQPLTSLEDHRHMLAHGMMSVDARGNDPQAIYFKGWTWINGELGETTLELSLDELSTMTHDMGQYVQRLVHLVARIFQDLRLAPITVAERQDMPVAYREF